jgi:hypothetical protein
VIELMSIDQALEALPVRKSREWLHDFLNAIPRDKYNRPIFGKAGRDKLIYFDRLLTAMGDFGELKPGTIYFIRCGEFIKIGYTTDLSTRMKSLRQANPSPIDILHSEPGGIVDERAHHKRFAHLRHQGEWFRAADELLVFIDELRNGA